MTYDVPVQMTVSEGFGPIPAPSPNVLVVNIAEGETFFGQNALIMDKTWREIKAAGICSFRRRIENGSYGVPETRFYAMWYIDEPRGPGVVDIGLCPVELPATKQLFTGIVDPDNPEHEYPYCLL